MTSRPTINEKAGHIYPEQPNASEHDRTADAEKQVLWQRYLEQQARRACPGCGDDGKTML